MLAKFQDDSRAIQVFNRNCSHSRAIQVFNKKCSHLSKVVSLYEPYCKMFIIYCKPTITKICPRIISLKFQILTYLAEVMVNGTNVAGLKGTPGPVPASLPNVTGTPPRGYKQVQTWKKLQKVPLGSIPYFTMRNLP